MHRTLTKTEQEVLRLLTDPTPEPKYALWEKVQYKKGTQIYEGAICGYHFYRVSIALAQDYLPGWRYALEVEGDDTEIFHENDIIGAIAS